MNFDIHQSCGI